MFDFEKNKKLADAFDHWRFMPRVLVGLYGYLFYEVTMWYMSLPDPSASQTGFVGTIIGAAAAIFGLYVNTGNKHG